MKQIKCENIFTAAEAGFLANVPTQKQTPDFCQTQTLPDPTVGTAITSFAFLATRVATVRI
jgi:hypothetical protein